MYVFMGLTCRIFDGENLGGLARVSGPSLVLSQDLELDLCSLDDVGHPVLTVRTRSLPALHPASSKLLLFLDGVPE